MCCVVAEKMRAALATGEGKKKPSYPGADGFQRSLREDYIARASMRRGLHAALNAELLLDILHTVKRIFKLTPTHHFIAQCVYVCL